MVKVEAQRKSSRVNNVVILRDVCHLLLLIVTCKDMAVLGGWMQIANSKCKEWVRGDKLHEIGGAEKTVVLFAHCYQYIISSSSILKKKKKKQRNTTDMSHLLQYIIKATKPSTYGNQTKLGGPHRLQLLISHAHKTVLPYWLAIRDDN